MVRNDHSGSVWVKAALLAALIAGQAHGDYAQAGDAVNGRRIVEDRALSACLLCHAGPFPAPHLQGNVGLRLDGVGDRLTPDEIRQRIVDPSRFNPDTVMPAYGKIDGLNRVGQAWRGRPILTPEQIEDVVAFLSTLHGP
jgi:sulfur-oxidizing protein SoxX